MLRTPVQLVPAALVALCCSLGVAPAEEKPAEKAPHLEFRIVASRSSDNEAMEAASKCLVDPKNKEQLAKLAKEGKPPLAPLSPEDKGFKTEAGTFTYGWVELSPSACREYRLDPDAKPDVEGQGRGYDQAFLDNIAKAREKGEATGIPLNAKGSGLLYSRNCVDSHLTEAERKQKKYDFFLLMRNPEVGKAITGKYLVTVTDESGKEGADIRLSLNDKGGELLHDLTQKNKEQALALILDGKILWSPTIKSVVSKDLRITGKFTKQEIEDLVKALRSDLPEEKK